MRHLIFILAVSLLLPAAASAQELEVNRRTYNFLENRLEVAVVAEAPGELQIVRGQRGRIEVAARSPGGIAGSGLGGDLTRQLRLTAVGPVEAQYLVVVPEHVNVHIRLPDGESASLASHAASASFSWDAAPARGIRNGRSNGMNGSANSRNGALNGASNGASYGLDPRMVEPAPLVPPTGGLYVIHSSRSAPAVVDVPDLASVRSLSLRFEGSDFRVTASRPLGIEPGEAGRLELRVAGEPLDVVLYLPHDATPFTLRAAGSRIAESSARGPRALCGNVIVQQPTEHQVWLTFRPQSGRIECR